MSTAHFYRTVLELAARRHETSPLKQHLDVGAGRGELIRQFRGRFGCESRACDYTTELMQVPGVTVDVVNLNQERLPYPDASFDIVTATEVVEHIEHYRETLREFHRVLRPGELCIVTTPNAWYPQSRLQFLMRGFFPSFPPLAGKVARGTHMHITPWSFPQLHVYFKLAGFDAPQVVREPLSHAKHFHERLLAIPARMYCRSRERRSASGEERGFWKAAASDESLLGRHLIVFARKSE